MFNWDDPDSISTSELVEVLSWKGNGDSETEEVAKKAGEILFYRFGPQLIKRGEILCGKHKRDIADALIIVERAIRKFIHSKTFSFEKAITKDPDRAVQAYLNSIVFNELMNLKREEKKIAENPYTGEERLIYDMRDLDVYIKGPNSSGGLAQILQLIDHVLSNVNEDHKMIYLSYFNAGVQPGKRPPDHLIKQIMDKTGLTRSSIRGIVNDIRNRIKPILDVYTKEK